MSASSDDRPAAVGNGRHGAPLDGDSQRQWQWPDSPGTKRINLALQGGGSHGAFTWGVLDRLLSDDRLEFEAVSGTSAGALNAIVMIDGLMQGGRQAARAKLKRFWHLVSDFALASPFGGSPFEVFLPGWNGSTNPFALWLDMFSRLASPYDFNPLNLNPLRTLLNSEVDFARVRSCCAVHLFVSATNVHTGRARVFTTAEMTADAVLASACLPQVFQAVEIDGVPYWDGGYMGNPVLFPFFGSSATSDVLLVQVNPIERRNTPRSSQQISDRLNEIAFNAPLIKELRQVDFINACLRRGELIDTGYREIFMHRIVGGPALDVFGASTKLNAQWSFLKNLRDIGRRAADEWLAGSFDKIGVVSTLDLPELHSATVGPTPLRVRSI